MDTKRIGPNMIAAVEFVRRHPGCAKLPVAEHVGPNCSRRYGYQSVDRAIRAGLIRAEKGNGIAYKLYVAE